MRRVVFLMISLINLILPVAAIAKDPVFVVTKPVTDKPTVTPDPMMGYLLLRTDQMASMHFMREASADDQLSYEKMRAAALVKEKKRYPGRLAAYRQNLATYALLKKSDEPAKKPEAPVEPTEENFLYPAFGLLAGASIGPMNRLVKGENGASIYLQSITPGSYRIYGLMSVLPGAAVAGVCFCMGSVKFNIRAGEVVDLGKLDKMGKLTPAAPGAETDARIKTWVVRPAEYRAVGKLPNYFGVTLSRIAAIDNVIAYDQDRIVDLAATSVAH